MSLVLSAQDLENLHAAMQAVTAPLASPSLDAWCDVVNERLVRLFQADAAVSTLVGPDGVPSVRTIGAADADFSAYRSYWQFHDHTAAEIQRRRLEIFTTSTLCEPYKSGLRPYHDAAIYHEYYRPNQIEDAVAMVMKPNLTESTRTRESSSSALPAWKSPTLFWAAYRSRYGTEHFGEKGLALLHLLYPAFRAGIETVFTAAAHRARLEQSLNLMSEGAWLCSSAGSVLYQNEAMTRMLASDPERERLKTALHAALRMLVLLHRVQRGKAAEEVLPAALPTLRTGRAAYRIRGSLLDAAGGETAPGLLVLLERLSDALPSSEELRERFGLTKQEASVALLLARRRRNEEIAAALHISPNTARRHTESILLKLGVHSRDEVESVMLLDTGL